MTANLAPLTGPADLRDQRWLDERISSARNGVEAVIDIALNWTEGRQVGRLHPGVAVADYVREHVGLIGREAVIPLLTESNWSNRQIAAVAGVGEATVRRTASSGAVDRPSETLGGDGKLRPAFRPRLDPAPDPYFAARAAAQSTELETDEPTRLEVDSQFWPQLLAIRDAIRELGAVAPEVMAASVPSRRRLAFAKELRSAGRVLGAVASHLEVME